MQLKYLGLCAIPLTVLLLYGASIEAPFVYDDRIHILENSAVTSFQSVTDTASIHRIFQGQMGLQGRPILFLTYAWSYRHYGSSPAAFRIVNLLIHTANSLLVFFLITELMRGKIKEQRRIFPAALTGALLFAAHPLLTESVTYIAGRSSSLCALFYFAALVFVLHAGRRPARVHVVLLLLSAASATLAWLVKQDAVTLPPAAIGLIWFCWPAFPKWRRITATALWACLLAAAIVSQRTSIAEVGSIVQGNAGLVAAGFEQTLPPKPYILTSIKELFGYYYWRMFLPLSLNVDPEPAVVNTFKSAGLWISGALLLALCGLAWRLRKRLPLVTVGFLLLIVSPLSAYAVFPLADVVSEHRAYISTVGAVVLISALLWETTHPLALACGIFVVYGWLTTDRNKVWRDEILLWKDAARQSPEKLRPHLNLGALYQAKGDSRNAIAEFEFVLKHAPQHDGALANLGASYLAENRVDQAEALLTRSIGNQTRLPAVYLNLSVVRIRQKRFEEARDLLRQALVLNPRQPMAHHNLGDILLLEDRKAQAIGEYLSELNINPDAAITHLHIAIAYEGSGAKGDSLRHYLRLQQLDPANTQAREGILRLQAPPQ